MTRLFWIWGILLNGGGAEVEFFVWQGHGVGWDRCEGDAPAKRVLFGRACSSACG